MEDYLMNEVNPYLEPMELQRFEALETSLNNIFQEEINSEDSIFISLNSNVVHKIALFLTQNIKRSATIGIAGETASGKSTITQDVIDTILGFRKKYNLDNLITRVNTDDYYYDRSELVSYYGSFSAFAQNYDLDIPDALELELMNQHISLLMKNQPVYLPKYDMSGTAKRIDNIIYTLPSKIIISEGLFTLTDKIRNVFDFKIYVHVSKEVQKERFFKRAQERNLGHSAHSVYANASNKAQIYIHPTCKFADIVLSGETSREKYKSFISKILNLAENFINNNKTKELLALK